jgi:RNA 3'-terminal phosphate cyclase (ATP)
MLTIDGAYGEGGGQILRSSLALSLVTGTPFRLERIRAGRAKPGLMRQHLTAVQAAAEIGRARVTGATIGSGSLEFRPGSVAPGRYGFSVGTAGSATLVLQTVLPPLLLASGRSELALEGGTHNVHAPPFDFLERVYLPLVRRMGPEVQARLDRPGFYPAGGGRFEVDIRPRPRLEPLELLERGPLRARHVRALVSRLPRSIAERELAAVAAELGWERREMRSEEVREPRGPGNVLMIELESEHVTEIVTGFGERGVPAETVAARAAAEARRYLEAGVPVGEHLADQLLLPLALAGGGAFLTLEPTAHTRTNAEVIARFLPVRVRFAPCTESTWQVEVASREN